MARPTKETVDYFPHFVKSGRTIFILESMYGNDGYAFWFKLLEILGETEGHYYDCSVNHNWVYILAKTKCDEDKAKSIIETLISLGKLDKDLWIEKKIIWCQKFVDNLSGVYKLRRLELPTKPFSLEDEDVNTNKKNKRVKQPVDNQCTTVNEKTNQQYTTGTPTSNRQVSIETSSKVKYSKEKKSIVKKNIYPYQDIVALWNEICGVSLPQVKSLNDSRRQKIKSRIDEFECKSNEDCLNKVKEIFERIQSSDFLCGENSSGWTATFDWVFDNSKNWIKVIEGNYDNNRSAKNTQQNILPGVALGVGEYIETQTGRRTYGTGKATIPHTAPARPSEKYCWDSVSSSWVLL